MTRNLILSTFCVLMLSGCQTIIPNVKPGEMIPKENESIVIGRLGIEISKSATVSLRVKNKEMNENYRIEAGNRPKSSNWCDDGSGYFMIKLPPGAYRTLTVEQKSLWGSNFRFNLNYHFNVPPSSVVYIGMLDLQGLESHYYVLFERKRIYHRVINEREKAVEYFQSKGYEFDQDIVESILQDKSRPPGLMKIDEAGDVKTLLSPEETINETAGELKHEPLNSETVGK